MIAWFLLMSAAALFMAINIIVGCYVAIRFGYGPPDWKTTLNLVVRVTTLQDRLNAIRDWLNKKAPWGDKLLDRLRVPKPIIIVNVPEDVDAPKDEEKGEQEENNREEGADGEVEVATTNAGNGETAPEKPGMGLDASPSVAGLLNKLAPNTSAGTPTSYNESNN